MRSHFDWLDQFCSFCASYLSHSSSWEWCIDNKIEQRIEMGWWGDLHRPWPSIKSSLILPSIAGSNISDTSAGLIRTPGQTIWNKVPRLERDMLFVSRTRTARRIRKRGNEGLSSDSTAQPINQDTRSVDRTRRRRCFKVAKRGKVGVLRMHAKTGNCTSHWTSASCEYYIVMMIYEDTFVSFRGKW